MIDAANLTAPDNGLPAKAPRPDKPPSLKTGPNVLAGTIVIALLVIGLGGWSYITPLEGAIIAPGVVSVESKRKTIQHLEGGIVSDILVRDGDLVEAGQVLLRLDATRAGANLGIIDGQRVELMARRARLNAELAGAATISFPDDLLARATDPAIDELLRGQQDLFDARRQSMATQVEILDQRIAQLHETIGGRQTDLTSTERQIRLIHQELRGVRELHTQGYAPLTRVLELQRAAEDLTGDTGELIASIAEAEGQIGEAQLQILQLENQMREEAVTQLRDIQTQIADMSERHVAATDELKRLELRAPQTGRIVGLAVHTRGAVISGGQGLMDIVPDDDELIVEARINPQDVDKIRPGQTARVRFSAFDYNTTPEMLGAVQTISADAMQDPDNGLSFYLAEVKVPRDQLIQLNDLELLPGMPAETYITTGERTVLSYLVKPLADNLSRSFRE